MPINKKEPEGNLFMGGGGGSTHFTDQVISSAHDFYLSGTITAPSNYIDWFHLIRNASENDFIRIHINSGGGDCMTAIQLMKCIKETPAHVHGVVEGTCASAATFAFLVCDSYEIAPHSIFMFHNYSGGTFGKGGEMKSQLDHEAKWSRKLVEEIYKDFLTNEEIEQILSNQDIWMDGEEVADRLRKRSEK